MDAETFNTIKKEYGKDASWAIWDSAGKSARDGYERHKHLDNYEEIKDRIKPNIVLVGLNQSLETPIKETFSNFHLFENDIVTRPVEGVINEKGLVLDPKTVENAEKLPYTFRGTEYEGAYMTDIIKFKTISGKVKSNAKSEDVMAYIKKHSEVEKENIDIFKDELKIIGSENPLIIAFGGNVNEILSKYFDVCQVTHYSHYIGKEKYREETLEKIKSYLTRNNEFTTDEKLKIIKKEGTFTDPRDGRVYKTVKIGKQVWMAENLAYYCAENCTIVKEKPTYVKKYGRLYDWDTAMKSCPDGWHLPNNEEWLELVNFAGGYEIAGEKLKATRGWNVNFKNGKSSGTDEYGFAALPAGIGISVVHSNTFVTNINSAENAEENDRAELGKIFAKFCDLCSVGELGCWWSDTEIYNIFTGQSDMYHRFNYDTCVKNRFCSVRCVQD